MYIQLIVDAWMFSNTTDKILELIEESLQVDLLHVQMTKRLKWNLNKLLYTFPSQLNHFSAPDSTKFHCQWRFQLYLQSPCPPWCHSACRGPEPSPAPPGRLSAHEYIPNPASASWLGSPLSPPAPHSWKNRKGRFCLVSIILWITFCCLKHLTESNEAFVVRLIWAYSLKSFSWSTWCTAV